jgi:hypothetical protein
MAERIDLTYCWPRCVVHAASAWAENQGEGNVSRNDAGANKRGNGDDGGTGSCLQR